MHYLRNIFCFFILAYVAAVLFLNSEWGSSKISGWLEGRISEVIGFDVTIGGVHFEMPHAVEFTVVAAKNSPYGHLKADRLILDAPFLKLIFGNLKEALIDVEGLIVEGPYHSYIPNDFRARLFFDEDKKSLHGTVQKLVSINAEFPFKLVGGATFQLDLTSFNEAETPLVFECMLQKMHFKDLIAEELVCSGAWNLALKEGYILTTADQLKVNDLQNFNVTADFEKVILSAMWNDELKEGHYSLTAEGLSAAKKEDTNALIHLQGISSQGKWKKENDIFDIAIDVSQIDDEGFALKDNSLTLKDLSASGSWKGDKSPSKWIVAVAEVQEDHFSLANARMEVIGEGHPNKWGYTFTTGGIYEDPFVASVDGAIALNDETYTLSFDHVDALFGEHQLSLVKSTSIDIDKTLKWSLQTAAFTADAGTFELEGSGSKELLDLKVQFPKQSFSNDKFTDKVPPLKGNLAGALAVHGPIDDLQAALEVVVDDLVISHSSVDKASLFKIQLSSHLYNKEVVMQGECFDRGVKLLELNGKLPMEQTGTVAMAPSRTREMAFHLFGQADLAQYLHSLIPPKIWVSGNTVVDVHLSGFFRHPNFRGSVKLVNGNFECWETGSLYNNISAEFDLTDDKINLNFLKGFDTQGGSVTAIGELDLQSALNYPFHIDFNINKSAVSSLDDVSVVLTGPVTLSGDLRGATLKGELVTDQLDIGLSEDSSAVDHDIEVVYVNQNDQEPAPTVVTKSRMPWPVCFDLHLVNNGNISIHSKELHSLWKGDVKITGCNDQYLLNGDFRIVKGEFDLPDYFFFGKKFIIKEGTISFAGDFAKKTSLYVVGEMELEDIVAQAVLKGPLSDPSLNFRSNPPFSQREILSWILFGRGMHDITPFQGEELAQSINQLKRRKRSIDSTGKKDGESILTSLARLKETLRLDRIGIDRTNNKEGKEEFSLQVGKYIMPQVFFGYKRNMSSDLNSFGLEASIFKNVKIEAEIGVEDADGKLHLKWKHDY